MCVLFTARVARLYRFRLVFVCVCLSGCQKLTILSLHHIIHLEGGWTHSDMSVCTSGTGCLSVAFCPVPAYPYPPPRQQWAVRSSLELILVIACLVLGFVFSVVAKTLAGRASPNWPIISQVGCKKI